MRISAIIVNYNGGSGLSACVRGLLRHLEVAQGKDEVIVVDNQSTDGSADLAEKEEGVTVVRTGENLGYGGGCNRGFEASSGDVLLFLNPDTELATSPASVRETFMRDGSCALVAPKVVEDGRVCGIKSLPSLTGDALGELGIVEPRSMDPRPGYFDGFYIGAALFVRRDAFERAGMFDERFFLYYEETDLFKRLGDLGFRSVYDPSCVIRHASGGCTGELEWRKTAIRYNSKYVYFSKHLGGAAFLAHRVFTVLGLLFKYSLGLFSTGAREKSGAYSYAIKLYLGGYKPWPR